MVKKMDEKYWERYARHLPLEDWGKEGQEKIAKSKVVIIGVGGLGTVIATQLAAIGVGTIRIVDRDTVSLTNLARQYLYREEEEGHAKVEVAEKRLLEINPRIKVEAISKNITRSTIPEIIEGMDVIVDGLDSFKTRMTVNEEAYGQGIPYVFAGAVGWTANATTFTFEEGTPCLECLFEGVDDDELPKCESAGVHPSILGIIASVEVAETVRLLQGQETRLKNNLLFVDLKELRFDKLQIAPRKDCEVCHGGKGEAGYLMKSGNEEVRKMSINEEEYNITELCGRATFVVSAKESPDWNFGKVIEKLRKKYKKISAFGTAAVTVFYSEEPKIEVSIVKGGTVTIKGLEEREEALKVFKEVISKHIARK